MTDAYGFSNLSDENLAITQQLLYGMIVRAQNGLEVVDSNLIIKHEACYRELLARKLVEILPGPLSIGCRVCQAPAGSPCQWPVASIHSPNLHAQHGLRVVDYSKAIEPSGFFQEGAPRHALTPWKQFDRIAETEALTNYIERDVLPSDKGLIAHLRQIALDASWGFWGAEARAAGHTLLFRTHYASAD